MFVVNINKFTLSNMKHTTLIIKQPSIKSGCSSVRRSEAFHEQSEDVCRATGVRIQKACRRCLVTRVEDHQGRTSRSNQGPASSIASLTVKILPNPLRSDSLTIPSVSSQRGFTIYTETYRYTYIHR